MSDPKRQQKSNSSRTIAIAAVAVLIVVAIAGIVLASRGPSPAPDGAQAVAAAAPVASTPQDVSAPTVQINPNEVVFGEASDKLPATATVSLGRFSEAAKNAAGVRMSARFLTGANKARDLELAKARTEAIRKVLVADAIRADKIQVELIEMPDGSLTVPDSNRIDLTLR